MSAPHKVSKERLERIATDGWLACATERVTELETQVQTLQNALADTVAILENLGHRDLTSVISARAVLAATEPK